MENNIITAAMEDYLECIYNLEKKDRVARVSAVGREMKVKKASVVAAIRYLKKHSLINQERYGFITMTDSGRKTASNLTAKHDKLAAFFENALKLAPERAHSDAKKARHYLSADVIDKMSAFAAAVKKQKNKTGNKWKK